MTLLEKAIGTREANLFWADPVKFIAAFDVDPWKFQRDYIGQITERDQDGIFKQRIAVVSMPRQNGKSTLSAWLALWRLYNDPNHQEIVSVALDRSSARIILDDARRIISNSAILMDQLDQFGLTKTTIRLKDGRKWEVKSSEALFSRGLRPSMVCYDELGWTADDGDLYQVLSAGQAAQINPLTVITSTVGPIQAGPLWNLFDAKERGDPDVLLIYETENVSPLISDKFIEGQREKLPAFVFAREHQNQWGSGTDVFCSGDDYKRAIGQGNPTRDRDPGPAMAFVDLGWFHDETAIAVGKQGDDQTIDIIHIEAFKGSRSNPVQLQAVENRILELTINLGIRRVEIESPQGVGMVQSLSGKGIHVEVIHPTAKSNRERWGALYTALQNGTIRIPRDRILRKQLLTLTIKSSETGWKVVDVPSIHNDRAVSCAGACYLARFKTVGVLPDQPDQQSAVSAGRVGIEKISDGKSRWDVY